MTGRTLYTWRNKAEPILAPTAYGMKVGPSSLIGYALTVLGASEDNISDYYHVAEHLVRDDRRVGEHFESSRASLPGRCATVATMIRLLILMFGSLLACNSKTKGSEETPPVSTPPPTSATASPESSQVPDRWDFYPAKINHAPASVMLNFWYGDRAPMQGFGHLLWVFIKMDNPGEHGMGLDEEAAATGPLEDALSAHVQRSLKAHFVARIRGEGDWQLYFYGSKPDGFRNTVAAFMKKHPARKFAAGEKSDPGWGVFKTLIFPDDERQRWMADNSVVETLKKEGDPLTEARRVDHWIYFRDEASRDNFEPTAKAAGFATQADSKTKNDEGQFGIQVHRNDFVDTERIHAVVMELESLATKHRGEYDGWETAVLRTGENAP